MEHNMIQEIPVLSEFQTLSYHTNKHKSEIGKTVILSSITADEEKALDNGKTITIIRKDSDGNEHEFVVSPKDTYGYGITDLHDGSDDADLIKRFKYYENLDFGGYPLPAFNYNNNTLLGGWFATRNPLTVMQYKHCLIGRPDRIIIFKS